MNNFAVPVILQVPVFPEELWLALTTRLDERGAWIAAAPLIAAPVVLLLVLWRAEISWPRSQGPATALALRHQLGGRCFRACAAGLIMALLLSTALPLGRLLISARTWAELPNVIRASPDVIANSAFFAAASATLCLGAGLLCWRRRSGLILWLPFFIPGVLLGRAMIFAFQGTVIYGTTILVLVAFAIRYFAVGGTGIAHALRAVDRDLTAAATQEGARGWALLRHVHWPQIAPQAAAAWYVTYLLCLWDVETLVLIYPPGGETLALRIFNLLHYGHHSQVNALCLLLLGLALAPWFAGRLKSRLAKTGSLL
jgi:iron(III) transport system permease protein